MYCPKCGTSNNDGAWKCQGCGDVLSQSNTENNNVPNYNVYNQSTPNYNDPSRYVPNYLVQAILVTIFCCLPFGIAAIVFASQVNSKLQIGDYAGAVETSNKARMWCWVSLGSGLFIGLIYFIIGFLGAMA